VQQAGPDTRDEIDLAGYATRLAARWWIVALAVAAAVGIAILQAQEETQRTWEGRTLVYLGQPVTPTGQPASNAPAAQPLFAQQVVRAPAAIEKAAAAAGLRPNQLTGRISIQGASGTVGTRAQPAPYVNVVVRGPWGRQVAAASQALGEEIVRQAGAYQQDKRSRLESVEQSLQDRIEGLQGDREQVRVNLANVTEDRSLTAAERASLQAPFLSLIQASNTLEFQLSQQLLDAQAQLASIEFNEAPRVVQEGRGTRVDVSSRQANLVVAVILGIVAGVILALLSFVVWPPGGRRRRKPAADAAS
jgi:hypothetical protein